jgi:hypothetical protein
MATCRRVGCSGTALAPWWGLCIECTRPLLDPAGPWPTAVVEQRQADGWAAMEWAERIAPGGWGNASDDEWVTRQVCLAFASVVTGRSNGCIHTASDVAIPVVAVARVTGVLRCPSCAEPVVAAASTTGRGCDRCGLVTVSPEQRVAAVTRSSLIIVGQLCTDCAGVVRGLD